MQVGILGVSYKTGNLMLRDAVARAIVGLTGEAGLFFPHRIVVLSTCNRTELYFSGKNLSEIHCDLFSYLRRFVSIPFEHQFYSYFGFHCFLHLSRVTAGLDSAILAETEIQSQVKGAYSQASNMSQLPSPLHFLFQKALRIGKSIRRLISIPRNAATLPSILWELISSNLNNGFPPLFIGNSQLNRELIAFFQKKGMHSYHLCTRFPTNLNNGFLSSESIEICDEISHSPPQGISAGHISKGGNEKFRAKIIDSERIKPIIQVTKDSNCFGREYLSQWDQYHLIISATKSTQYLLVPKELDSRKRMIFDLSVPRNIDPAIGSLKGVTLYNIEQLNKQVEQNRTAQFADLERSERLLLEHVLRLYHSYQERSKRSFDQFPQLGQFLFP